MKAYMKRAYSYYANYSKQMDAAVTEYSRRTLEGSLRESAVARLLVEGKLPPENSSAAASTDNRDDPVDLSSKGRLQGTLSTLPIGAIGTNVTPATPTKSVLSPPPNGVTIDGHEPTVEVLQRSLRREMDKLKEAKSEVPGDWKCRYCPYTAPTSKTLYSHYQFHQQLLASQSSRAHLEWLSAYRKAKESGLEPEGEESLPFAYPPHPNLTYGVIGADKTAQPSASGFLKAIVKAVMHGKTSGESVTSTSIYSILTNDGSTPSGMDLSAPLSPLASRRKKRKLEPHSACPNAKDAKYENTSEDTKINIQELMFQDPCENVGPHNTDPQAAFAAKVHELLISDRKPDLPLTNDVSMASVKDTASPFSTTKSSYLDSLPLRKRSKEAYFDGRLAQYTVEVQSNLIPALSREESDSESTTTTTTIQESLEKTDITAQANFTTDDDQDSIKDSIGSPRSVCSEIDVGTDVMFADKTVEDRMIGTDNHLHSKTREKSLSDDSGHVTSPLYRPCSIDSVSSMESGSGVQLAADNPQATRWQMNDLECINEEDGDISHRGVQCDILLPTSFPSDPTRHRSSSSYSSSSSFSSSSSDSDCETSTSRLSKRKRKKVIKCFHCGISFEDEVLHSIHMGCHSHTDPYNCNVCGRSCGNRYGFYTHIMRGHLPI